MRRVTDFLDKVTDHLVAMLFGCALGALSGYATFFVLLECV